MEDDVKKAVTKICPECLNEFTPRNSLQKTCLNESCRDSYRKKYMKEYFKKNAAVRKGFVGRHRNKLSNEIECKYVSKLCDPDEAECFLQLKLNSSKKEIENAYDKIIGRKNAS